MSEFNERCCQSVEYKVIRADGEVLYEGHLSPGQVWHGEPERVSWDIPGLPEVRARDKIVAASFIRSNRSRKRERAWLKHLDDHEFEPMNGCRCTHCSRLRSHARLTRGTE